MTAVSLGSNKTTALTMAWRYGSWQEHFFYKKKNSSLYRNDGLAIFKTIIGKKKKQNQFKKIKKDIQKLFKENEFDEIDIVIHYNMKTVNYLDVTLDLENSTDRPYQKENNQIKYIDIDSNHPPFIIK